MKVNEYPLAGGEQLTVKRSDGVISIYIVEGECSDLTYAQPVNVVDEVTVTADKGPILVRAIHV